MYNIIVDIIFSTNLDLVFALTKRDLCPSVDNRSMNINENKTNNGQ